MKLTFLEFAYKKIKGFLISLSFILSLLFLLLLFCNYIVISMPSGLTYNVADIVPNKEYGLVLGTSPYNRHRKENEFFRKRIVSAVELYQAKKIKKIIVSGDGNNNEPQIMKQKLLSYGVKKEDIFLDYKGYDTFSSVKRAYFVFGCSDITIISQEFHNKRALFLAKAVGINAIGYNSKDVTGYFGDSIKMREFFARVKAVIDVLYYKKNNQNLSSL